MGPERRILAFGDSLFAGYGVAQSDSYPAKLEAALRAGGINARVLNAGVSGDTTAAGLQRLAFTLDAQEEKPELFILELGGNDLLRGLPPKETRANIEAMLAELQKREIPVLLMGMRAPPNFGDLQDDFDNLYPELAAQYDADLVPFFMEPMVANPELIQSDRVHPTEEGIDALVDATKAAVKDALPDL
ncbi:arylesterase [Altererythrobacter aquaemixtae]|uniref:Arylesterase n=2 Tax=Pontixanthobacter aquaemixtae TaxID=1958940 RepID=A0A844ZU35_9SPHN|nr:arylesterase [Pontixanthobacter aquaemixtae]